MSCFLKLNGTVVDVSRQASACGMVPAKGAVPCCFNGDTCMSDGFCQYTHSGVAQGSGFYRAACTDPTVEDPSCPPECSSEAEPDAVFNYGTGSWQCCGGSPATGISCNQPRGLRFQGPAPGLLTTFDSNVGMVAGPSTGAVVGISIAASIGVLLLVASVVTAIFRWRQHRKINPFRRGTEPQLLPVAVRSGEPTLRSLDSSSSHFTAPRVTPAPGLRNSWMWPKPQSPRSGHTSFASDAESISTWSSFSSGSGRAPAVRIEVDSLPDWAPAEIGDKSPQSAQELDSDPSASPVKRALDRRDAARLNASPVTCPRPALASWLGKL